MIYNVGSLFAGVGGICLGFQQSSTPNSGFKLQWANEIDEFACETYKTNFDHMLLQGDIEKIIHPTRIDQNVESLRTQIKTIEEEKDKIQSNIKKIEKTKNGEEDTEKFYSYQAEIDSLIEKVNVLISQSQHKEEELTNILQDRDAEFTQYLQNGCLPNWINEQDKLDEFNKYLTLRCQIIEQPIDVLNGGFPCQAFSIAGEQHGFKDPRGNLFLSIVDLIELLGETHTIRNTNGDITTNGKPRILFLENVKNLKSHDNGRTYDHIKESLEKCGYTIFEKVLNTMDYSDLPQNRERIYIIGFRDKCDAEQFTLFTGKEIEKYKVNKIATERHQDVKRIINYSKSMTINNANGYYYTSSKYPNYYLDGENSVNLDKQVDEMYQFYQCRRGQYVRKNKSDVCPTLTANMGTGGHNVPLIKVHDGIRKITPSEAFKLQGFPVGNGYTLPTVYNGRPYSDSHLYKQAGNAVSVPMIKLIATDVLKILESSDNQ